MQARGNIIFVNEKIIRKYSFCPFSPWNTRQMHFKRNILMIKTPWPPKIPLCAYPPPWYPTLQPHSEYIVFLNVLNIYILFQTSKVSQFSDKLTLIIGFQGDKILFIIYFGLFSGRQNIICFIYIYNKSQPEQGALFFSEMDP